MDFHHFPLLWEVSKKSRSIVRATDKGSSLDGQVGLADSLGWRLGHHRRLRVRQRCEQAAGVCFAGAQRGLRFAWQASMRILCEVP